MTVRGGGDVCCTAWALGISATKVLQLNKTRQMRYLLVSDLALWKVVHVSVHSPLHTKVLDKFASSSTAFGVTLHASGVEKEVLAWQVDRGFADVPTAALKKLAADLKISEASP